MPGDTFWAHYGQKSAKITVFLDDFSPKLTIVCPKCVSCRSNQEWHSICADTVVFSPDLWESPKIPLSSKKFPLCTDALVKNMAHWPLVSTLQLVR